MRKKIILIFTYIFIATNIAFAQSVNIDAKIDSLQILIGEQAKLKLEVSMDAKQKALFPNFTDTIVKGIEIVDVAKVDTQYLNNNKRMVLSKEYTITSFDSALYYIPPIEVLVDQKSYKSKSLGLKVYSIPVDTTNVDKFFPQRGIMEAPFVWSDWQWCVYLFVISIALGFLVYYLVKRLKDNKPIIRKVKVEPKIPPHKLAIKELDKIKQEKVWQQGETKEYYTELTDTIREYIDKRFGFNALEMTSSEIIEQLKKEDSIAINELKELFETADLVKFAKHHPDIVENDSNLINALDFINETKIEEDPNKVPEPTEVTIIEKRPFRIKIMLIVGISLSGIIIIASLVYIIVQMLTLFV